MQSENKELHGKAHDARFQNFSKYLCLAAKLMLRKEISPRNGVMFSDALLASRYYIKGIVMQYRSMISIE